MAFGELVRAHRRRMGLTQDDLAAKAGVGVRSLRDIEANRARPRPATVRLLADALTLMGADRDRFFDVAAGDHAAAGPPRPGWPRPAQLPHGVVGFVGRDDVLTELDALVDAGGPAVVGVITGAAGVGKTAAVVHWAHRVAGRFPDGQLFVNLRGFDPSGSAMSATEAVRGFLYALGVPPARLPDDVDAQVGLYRSLLAGRRVLVVLDNARDGDQVRPLLPGAPGCVAVVTSRRDLSDLVVDGARPVAVGLLPHAQARRLLAARVGEERVAAEPEAAEEIVVRCGRLPLALTIAAARAGAASTSGAGPSTPSPLRRSAEELRREGLAALSVGGATTDVRAVFGWSYRALSEPAARLYRRLGLAPGPDVSAAAAASLAGAEYRAVVRPWLDELIRASLLTEPGPDRFAFHDLLRAHAAELAVAVDGPEERRAAWQRLLDFYVHTGHTAAGLLVPQREGLGLPDPRPGVATVELTKQADAAAWFVAEYAGLMAALERAVADGFDAEVVRLAWVLVDFQDTRGLHRDWLATQTAALEAARRLADRRMEAAAHRFLGRANTRLGRFDEAEAHLTAGIAIFDELGDVTGRATAHHSLALLVGRLGRHADAVHHGQRALDLYRAADHRPGQARTHNTVGWYLGLLGRPAEAIEHCERGLALHQEIGNTHGEAATWDSLGHVHHTVGDHARAVRCYERAVDLLGEADPGLLAVVLTHLGEAHLALGDPGRARSAWRRAVAVLERLEDPEADALRARLADLER